MPPPTFSCDHPVSRSCPLPLHTPYPPPASLPHPCRSCSHTLCRSAANDIKAQYDPIIADLTWRIDEAKDRLWGGKWDKGLEEKWEAALKRNEGLKAEERRKLNNAWALFEEHWGLGRGNGVKWRDEEQV